MSVSMPTTSSARTERSARGRRESGKPVSPAAKDVALSAGERARRPDQSPVAPRSHANRAAAIRRPGRVTNTVNRRGEYSPISIRRLIRPGTWRVKSLMNRAGRRLRAGLVMLAARRQTRPGQAPASTSLRKAASSAGRSRRATPRCRTRPQIGHPRLGWRRICAMHHSGVP